jgi:hypothetical protein
MGSRKVSDAHKELSRDLATREPKGLLEQPHPIPFRLGMVGCQPLSDGTVSGAKTQEHSGVVDGGLDLQTITNDFRVAHEPCPVGVAVVGYDPNVEVVVGAPETLLFFKIVSQDEAAWLILRRGRSEGRSSSVTGKPYSSSWYGPWRG